MTRRATKICPGQSLGFLPSPADIARFVAKLQVDSNGCWIFTGCRDSRGYGQIRIGRRVVWAHRLAFSLFRSDERLAGNEVDHKCHVQACCNPEHLESCSSQQNRAGGGRRRAQQRQAVEDDIPF